MLVAASDGERFVTGGDDGRVVVTGADGSTKTLAETKGAWIDSLASSTGGAFAYGIGKRVIARDDKGREKVLEVPSAARGLAFAPKGYRLAIAHYNGATLWFPNVEAKPEFLEWKGSHLDITWSPDARFVVTSMQENALHGWRLVPDKGHMRMSGYPSKTRSVSWSGDGKWLATSGAEAAILWPFDSKEGPMGKQPRECGVRPAKVSRVAFHPNTSVLAVGYEDGCILLIRLTRCLRASRAPGRRGQRHHGPGLGPGRKAPRLRLRRRSGRHSHPADVRSTVARLGAFIRGTFGAPEADRRRIQRVKDWARAALGRARRPPSPSTRSPARTRPAPASRR